MHSSRRRGRIGKVLLEASALLTASAVAGSVEPTQVNVRAGSHLPQLLTYLTPITTRHALTVVPADIILIDATPGVTDTVIGERLGAVNPPCACPLLSVCCLRESQARLRAILRVRAPPMALSRRPVRAAVRHADRNPMCGSWSAGRVARCAGATRVRAAGVPRRLIFRYSCGHISGPREAPGVISGGSDMSDRCSIG